MYKSSVSILVVGVFISLSLFMFLRIKEAEHLFDLSQEKVDNISSRIRTSLENDILTISRMATRWNIRDVTPKKEWLQDSRSYINDNTNFQAISKIDENYLVRWIVPIEGNEEAIGLDLSFEKERRDALIKSKTLNRPCATKVIELVQGGRAVLIFFPLYKGKRFDGFISAVFKIDTIIKKATKSSADIYIEEIDIEENTIVAIYGTKQKYSSESNFQYLNIKWNVKYFGPIDYFQLSPYVLFALSLIFILLAGVWQNKEELKASNSRLKFAIVSLRESNAELEQFAYISYHDLQEPLRMVSGLLSLLRKEYYEDIDEEGKEYIDISINAAKRMSQMVSGLLEFSRVGRNSDVKAENLTICISKAINNIKKGSKANIVFDKDNISIAMVDELQMISLFQNIISNAIKYCEVDPEIIINIKKNKDSLLVSIKDNGIGIAKESQKDIFLIFHRLVANRFEGAGIGLSICNKIVTSHHGKIWVESDGNGSTFYIELPIEKNRSI